MQAAALVQPLAALFSGGAAAGTAVGAASAAGTLATMATVVSSAAGIITTLNQRDFEDQRADQLQEAASRRLFSSQVEAQETDFEAAAAMEQQLAQQAASGLDLSSGSFQAARRKNKVTARLNTLRVRQEGEIDAANYRQEASDARTKKRQLGTQLIFDAVAGGINTGASLIERSARIDAAKARSITRQARLV